ncbi:hypothetical protein CDAR_402071 [Caerostris darwini]|uniref:Uncharacterized protein n=1 Tax=Caerostris darwini TaxID=1538125 RepID=A0AAV4T1Z9_9ARAC|nr:hypothetical protein CDAR_402071 [Caerostris darwini]
MHKILLKKLLGKKEKKANEEWITGNTWKLIEERKKIKHTLESIKSERQLQQNKEKYRKADRNVKRNVRKNKRDFYETLAAETQRAAEKGEIRTFFQAIKQISGNERKRELNVKEDNKVLS